MRSLWRQIPKYPPLVWTLILGTAGSCFAVFMCMPFLAIYLARNFGMDPVEIGITVGMGPLALTFGGFFCGHLADRFGRRRVLIVSMAAMAVFFGLYGVVGSCMGPTLAGKICFGLVNFLSSLATACFHPASQALIADLLPPEERHEAFRLRYCAINAGSALGPLLGAYMGVSSSNGPFFATAAVLLIYMLVLIPMTAHLRVGKSSDQDTSPTLTDAFHTVRKDHALLALVLAGALFNLAYVQLECSLSQHMVANVVDGVRAFSYIISINGFCVILIQLALLPLLRKMRALTAIYLGSAIFAAGMLGFAWAGAHFRIYAVACVVITLGEVLVFPSSSILLDELAPAELRATYYGSSNLRHLGNTLGPVAGGAILQWWGGSALFISMAAVGLASAGVFWLANIDRYRVSRKPQSKPVRMRLSLPQWRRRKKSA